MSHIQGLDFITPPPDRQNGVGKRGGLCHAILFPTRNAFPLFGGFARAATAPHDCFHVMSMTKWLFNQSLMFYIKERKKNFLKKKILLLGHQIALFSLSFSLAFCVSLFYPHHACFFLVKERPLINLRGSRCPCRAAFSVSLITAIVITGIVFVYSVLALKHHSPVGHH